MISAIVSNKKPVFLLDEPEAFLHPPQALQLGEIISGLVEPSQQIFIATHSADFSTRAFEFYKGCGNYSS